MDESSHHCEQWLSATRLTPKEQNPSELTTTVIYASQKMKSYCHDLHRRETVSHAKSAKPFIDLSCWRISKRNGNIHLQRNSWWAFVCWMTSEWISKHLQEHNMTSKYSEKQTQGHWMSVEITYPPNDSPSDTCSRSNVRLTKYLSATWDNISSN